MSKRKADGKWRQILDLLKAQMPDMDDTDAALCARLIGKQAFGVGDDLELLRAQHMARPGPHDDSCSACGFFDSARYHEKTGRYLSRDMGTAKARG